MARQHGGHHGEHATRPRYRRIVVAGSSALVTLVAVFGAIGFIPSSPEAASATSTSKQQPESAGSDRAGAVALRGYVAGTTTRQTQDRAPVPEATDLPAPSVVPAPEPKPAKSVESSEPAVSTGLPSRSGVGKRVVFDMSDQRVWLVSAAGKAKRTYPVSGSLTDNLSSGTYEVFSTSINAVGVDNSGTMKYMVRFEHGEKAAIGFHDIPIKRGKLVQTRDQLGTPRSHGCIRQLRRDAKALWDFAPTGTKVVVLD